MSLIRDEVSQFMGGGSSRRFLTPVDIQAGETTRDRYRYMVNTLREENAIQTMMAETEKAKLVEETSAMELNALSQRDVHLDQLQKLDPSSDTFDDHMVELNAAAAHDPAVQRALSYKMQEREVYTTAMMGLAQTGAVANLTPDEHEEQVRTARKFLLSGNVDGYSKLLYQNTQLAEQRQRELKLENMEKNYEIQSRYSEKSAQRSEERQKRMYDNQRERELERQQLTHADKLATIRVPGDLKEIDPEFMAGDLPGNSDRLPLTLNFFAAQRIEGALANPDFAAEDVFSRAADPSKRKNYVEEVAKALYTVQDKDAFVEMFGVREPKDKNASKLVKTPEEMEAGEFVKEATKLAADSQFNAWLENLWEEAQGIHEYSAEFTRWRSIAPERSQKGIEAHNEKVREAREKKAEEKKVPESEKAAASSWVRNVDSSLAN